MTQSCLDLDTNPRSCTDMLKDNEHYQQMIEEKSTADESVDGSSKDQEEGVECTLDPKDLPERETMEQTKKPRACLLVGIGIVLLFAVLLAVVAAFVAKSFSNRANSNENPDFDFGDVNGPNFEFIDVLKPSAAPSDAPTKTPTTTPSSSPSSQPSSFPTPQPSSQHPSSNPTSLTASPSMSPSNMPSERNPTISPAPSTKSPISSIVYTSETLMTFCAIADVPYSQQEIDALPQQIATQMQGCEFLVHLGDIMKGEVRCTEARFNTMRDILLESPIPVFVLPGDNEWNDCGGMKDINYAWGNWTKTFMMLKNLGDLTFNVVRQDNYPENFYFIHKRTLVFGLNIVGGRVHNEAEWVSRLSSEQAWVRQVTQTHIPFDASGVIIMAHARPTLDHRHFFDPIQELVANELSDVPVLYLHGDGHTWIYTEHYYSQPNYLRIQHEGGVRDPILKILADPERLGPHVTDAFQADRQLHLERN